MPEELPFNPVAILGAVLLLGGATGLFRWLDAWTPWGGLERTYRGFLLATMAAVLPELVVAAASHGLGNPFMAERVASSSVLWRLWSCGLLAMVMPPARNPLLPGRNLATLLPAVAMVVCILVFAAAILLESSPHDPMRRALASTMIVAPYLGCLWLVWRTGMESKGKPFQDLEADLAGPPTARPRLLLVSAAIAAIIAGGVVLMWAVNNSLLMLTAAHGSNFAWRNHSRHVLLILGALLTVPTVVLAWHDRRKEATALRPTRELLACSTLMILVELMRHGPFGRSDVTWGLTILGGLASGTLAVLFASVERFVPVQVRGLTMFLVGLGVLILAWRL